MSVYRTIGPLVLGKSFKFQGGGSGPPVPPPSGSAHALHAGGSDLRLYDGPDLKLSYRREGPDFEFG